MIDIVMKCLLPHLQKTIAKYDNRDLIERLIGLNESLINEREHKKISTPTRIACFVSEEQHIQDLMESLSELSRTTIAVRCLVEHLRAEPAKGTKPVSKTAIDELIGIMDSIIAWGSTGDQITYHLFDVKMKVLNTGRIAIQKSEAEEIFDPYYQSKTKETVHDALTTFKQEFPKYGEERIDQNIPTDLDKAFKEEFSISLSRISTFLDILASQIFVQKTSFIVMNKTALFTLVQSHRQPFDETEFRNALEFLSHKSWGDVTKPPKGYDTIDISPWRFNRKLSLLRKPIIICDSADQNNPLLFWGPRQVMVSRITILDQLLHDRFKVNEKGPIKKAMSKFSQVRGTSLVVTVLEGLKIPNTILDSEVAISGHGKLRHSSDIGDIDVLLIDLFDKMIYSLECKSFAPSRNIKEMIEECEKLIGSQSDKGLIQKHVIRHQWITTNLKKVGALYKQDLIGFRVKSVFVTREDMLFPHMKQTGIEMPFVTLYELKNDGYGRLKKLPYIEPRA